MNNIRPLTRTALAALLLAAGSQSVMAAEANTAYVGVGAGNTRFGYDSTKCTTDLGAPCTLKSTDTGIKVFVGYNLTPVVALEGTYVDFGKITGSTVISSIPVAMDESETAFYGTLVATGHLNDTFSVIGKAGFYGASVTVHASATGAGGTFTGSDSGNVSGAIFGAGIGIDFTPNFIGKIEFEHFDAASEHNTNIDLASGSLAYNF